jgi:predicted metalloprotease
LIANELARSTSHLRAFYDEMIGLKREGPGGSCCNHTKSQQNVASVPVASYFNEQNRVGHTAKTVKGFLNQDKL